MLVPHEYISDRPGKAPAPLALLELASKTLYLAVFDNVLQPPAAQPDGATPGIWSARAFRDVLTTAACEKEPKESERLTGKNTKRDNASVNTWAAPCIAGGDAGLVLSVLRHRAPPLTPLDPGKFRGQTRFGRALLALRRFARPRRRSASAARGAGAAQPLGNAMRPGVPASSTRAKPAGGPTPIRRFWLAQVCLGSRPHESVGAKCHPASPATADETARLRAF